MNKRPQLLTTIAVFGLIYATAGLLLGIIALFSSTQLLSQQIAATDFGPVAKFAAAAMGLFALAFVGSGILRIAVSVGMLKMKRWAYKLFYIIVILSALAAIAAVTTGVAVTWHIFFLVVESAILWYLHSIRATLA